MLLTCNDARTDAMMPFCFQETAHTGLRPLYYKYLDDDTLRSICVSGNFLVGFGRPYGKDAYVSTYSLPDLQPGKNTSLSGSCFNVRADSDGQVYAGCGHMVSVLEISETGNISVTRNLTVGGLLAGKRNAVAGFGPSPGQVWVYGRSYENATDIQVYLIDVNTDSVIKTFTPDSRDIPYGNRPWASFV